MKKEGDKIDTLGNMVYMAPEIFFPTSPVAEQSMDMFSFAILLLRVMDEKLFLDWDDKVSDVNREYSSCYPILDTTREACSRQFRLLLENLQMELTKKGDHCSLLIRDLINFSPKKRPTCEQTLVRLKTYVDNHEYERGFFHGTLFPLFFEVVRKIRLKLAMALSPP